MLLGKLTRVSAIILAGACLSLTGCGSGSRPTSSGNFPGTMAHRSERAIDTVTSHAGVAGRPSATTLTPGNPKAKFHGCWYQLKGHRYQGVDVSVGNPGTYPFDADLYRGATCNPAQKIDEFGFGNRLHFGGFGYIFWFTDFHDQSDTSALWHVGIDTSKCVNYAVAPDCP